MTESAPPAAPEPPAAPAAPEPPATPSGPVQLPDDHPLVKAFNAQKTELVDAKKRLTDIDEAQKTDAQKQADRITALETENATLKAAALKATVAAAKGVPAELLSGSTEAELNAAADRLLAFRGTPGAQIPGNQQPSGPLAPVQEPGEESKEDRRARLAKELPR